MNLRDTIWKLSLVENVKDKLARIQAAADKTGMHMRNLDDKVGGLKKGANAAFSEMSSQLPGMGSGISKYLTNPYVAAGLAVTAITVGAAKMAMSFDENMHKINATAQLSKKELGQLGDQILEYGKSGYDPMKLSETFEKVNSQVNDVTKSLEVTKIAAKGAKGGFADMVDTGAALAQTLSAIGGSADAAEVMDAMFKGKNLGGAEFKDFAQYVPGLIASGRNLGITFKDTTGMFAFMTARGQDAASSAMLMQNAFSALGKTEITGNLKKFGVNVFDSKGAMRGLDEIFTDLNSKTKDLTDQQKSALFENLGLRDSQAKQAFSVLLGDAQGLKSIMDGVRNSAGETDRTIAATANPMQKIEEIGNKFKSHMTDIGMDILPVINSILDWVVTNIEWGVKFFSDWYASSEMLQDIVWAIGKLFEGIGMVIGAVAEGVKMLWVNIIKPMVDAIGKVYSWLKNILGFSDNKLEIKAEVEHKVAPDPWSKTDVNNLFKTPPTAGQRNNAMISDKNAGKSVDGIHGGGSQQRNVYVTIGKFQDAIHIHAATVKEGASDMRKIIQEEVTRALFGAEMAMSNG